MANGHCVGARTDISNRFTDHLRQIGIEVASIDLGNLGSLIVQDRYGKRVLFVNSETEQTVEDAYRKACEQEEVSQYK